MLIVVALAVAACGGGSPKLLTAEQVQAAFLEQGLTTTIFANVRPTGVRGRSRESTRSELYCPLLNLGSPGGGVIAVIGDRHHFIGHGNRDSVISAAVLSSVKAADSYLRRARPLCDESLKLCKQTATDTLQDRNVVVVVVQHGPYKARVKAALAHVG